MMWRHDRKARTTRYWNPVNSLLHVVRAASNIKQSPQPYSSEVSWVDGPMESPRLEVVVARQSKVQAQRGRPWPHVTSGLHKPRVVGRSCDPLAV